MSKCPRMEFLNQWVICNAHSGGEKINTATVTALVGPMTMYLASKSLRVIIGAIGNWLLTPCVVIKNSAFGDQLLRRDVIEYEKCILESSKLRGQ